MNECLHPLYSKAGHLDCLPIFLTNYSVVDRHITSLWSLWQHARNSVNNGQAAFIQVSFAFLLDIGLNKFYDVFPAVNDAGNSQYMYVGLHVKAFDSVGAFASIPSPLRLKWRSASFIFNRETPWARVLYIHVTNVVGTLLQLRSKALFCVNSDYFSAAFLLVLLVFSFHVSFITFRKLFMNVPSAGGATSGCCLPHAKVIGAQILLQNSLWNFLIFWTGKA